MGEKVVMTAVGPIPCVPVGQVGADLFKCRVCGVDCPIAPAGGQAVCADHCEDHEYVYEGSDGHRCKHCFAFRPEDWNDEY